MTKTYIVSQVKNHDKLYYAHKKGFPSICLFGSIGTRKHATEKAACAMGLLLDEYKKLKE